MGWQCHQLDHIHMQIICTSLQTDNHASTSPLSFYRPAIMPTAQPTASKHWRCKSVMAFFWNIACLQNKQTEDITDDTKSSTIHVQDKSKYHMKHNNSSAPENRRVTLHSQYLIGFCWSNVSARKASRKNHTLFISHRKGSSAKPPTNNKH